MRTARNAGAGSEAPTQSKGKSGLLRKTATVILAAGVSVLLAVLLGALLLYVTGSVQRASAALHAIRPWLITAQIVSLGLTWHYWPGVVGWCGRMRNWSPAAQAALIRGRTRIFVLLAACESLIVLRALAS